MATNAFTTAIHRYPAEKFLRGRNQTGCLGDCRVHVLSGVSMSANGDGDVSLVCPADCILNVENETGRSTSAVC